MTDKPAKKCAHAYYDKVALGSMCDFYCKPCDGYDEKCVRPKETNYA